MWKESVVAQFKIIFHNFPEGLRKTHSSGQDSMSLGRDTITGPSDYEEILPLKLRRLALNN
jgi:hypothetical protein